MLATFSRIAILSHRLRVALFAASLAGTILAAVFTGIAHFSHVSALRNKGAELSRALSAFTPSEDDHFDLTEFHEAFPNVSASVYDGSGRLRGAVGPLRSGPLRDLSIHDRRISVGTLFKGEDVVLTTDTTDIVEGLERLNVVLVSIWLPLALLVGLATWIAMQQVFRPLDRLSSQAFAMSGADLSERLATQDRAEFGAFAARLNGMLDRIEETVQRGERFSTDAAHEFRTPLALLRTRLETTILRTRSVAEYEMAIRRSIEEIGRLTAITESLLRSARGEAQAAESVDLRSLIHEASVRWRERFASRGVALDLALDQVSATIHPDEVRVVMDNLLDNALRYSPAGSNTTVRLAGVGDGVLLSVLDQGSGIPAELGEGVFDRFVRADDSRNREYGGAGIGLAVCRQIVVGRGGRMFLGSEERGATEVGCVLPRSVRA